MRLHFLKLLVLPLAIQSLSAGILFQTDFEEKSTIPAGAKLVDGLRGKGVLTSPDAALIWPAAGKIDPNGGSLSFKIKPLDWDLNSKGKWFPLFWLGTRECGTNYYYLLIDTRQSMPYISLFSRCTPRELAARYVFQGKMRESFKRGAWTHVVLTWSKWQFFLYINGQQVSQHNYSLPFEPLKMPRDFSIYFGNTHFWKRKLNYSSVFDEIEIHDRMLTAAEVNNLYEQTAPAAPRKTIRHRLPVPKTAHPVKIDGIPEEKEWCDATRVPLNKRFFTRLLTQEPAWAMIKYDDKNLYVAAEIPCYGKYFTPGSSRGMKVFAGDNFEITVRCPKLAKTEQPFFQFAMAPNGAWAFNRFGKWDTPSPIRHKVRSYRDKWFAEAEIPLAIFPEEVRPGAVWLLQFGIHTPSDAALKTVQDRILGWSNGYVEGAARYAQMFHYPECMGEMVFQADTTGVRIDRLGNPVNGNLDFVLSSAAPMDLSVDLERDKISVLSRKKNSSRKLAVTEKLAATGMTELTIQAFPSRDDKPLFAWQSCVPIKEPISAEFRIQPERSSVKLDVNIAAMPAAMLSELTSKGLNCSILVRDAAGKEVFGSKKFTMKKTAAAAEVGFRELPPGRYEIVIAVGDGGRTFGKKLLFERPSDEFLRMKENDYGRKVPAPWTPVNVETPEKIGVFGREYLFAANGFPRQMVSRNENIFVRPPELIVHSGGKARLFNRIVEPAAEAERHPDFVLHRGVAETEDGAFRLEWKRRTEFDGLVLYDVTLSAGKGRLMTIDRLELAGSLCAASSRCLQAPDFSVEWSRNNLYSGALRNYFWFSGINSGLDIAVPDDGNWVFDAKTPAVFFKRDGKDADARLSLRLIGKKVTTEKSLRYSFGLMATPVRPVRADFRKTHAGGNRYPKNQNLQEYWLYNDKVQDIQFPNIALLTDVSDPVRARKEISRFHNRGIRILPNSLHTAMPDNNPYYDYYGEQWLVTANGIPGSKSYHSRWQGKEFYMCCPVCPRSAYSQFLNWCGINLMKKYKFNGLYLDGGQSMRCDNIRHGCGYTDAFGRRITPWNDFACRNSLRRIYTAIHETDPDGVFWVHAGVQNAPHIHSFADFLLTGEDLLPNVPANPQFYTDGVPPEKWQSTYQLPRQLGVAAMLIGLVQKYTASTLKPPADLVERYYPLLTMCLLHDVNLYGHFMWFKTMEDFWGMIDACGISAPDAVFTGYWYPNCRVRTDRKNVLASYYTFPGSERKVVIVGNTGKNAESCLLEYPASWLPTDGKVKNLRTGKMVDPRQRMNIPRRNFEILEFQP